MEAADELLGIASMTNYTYYKKMGHWKNECPQQKQVGYPNPKPILAMEDQ